MARSKTFVKKINVVQALQNLGNFNAVSYFHHRQLVADGYAVATKNPDAKKEGRGRMPLKYEISKKGANLVRLSASWAKPKAATEEVSDVGVTA